VFLKGKDKINVVFYSDNTRFYSLDKTSINYVIFFNPEIEFLVPGGYGYYKTGALGKLVSLEKKPDIFKKTFSTATSCFIDLYFYPEKTSIYYQKNSSDDNPTFSDIFFTKSNASFVDRLFILINFINHNHNYYQTIDKLPLENKDNRALFDYNKFYKDYQGNFYQKTYRNNHTNVQIVYTKSYQTAGLISQVVEGEGIRVVDLSIADKQDDQCILMTKKELITTPIVNQLKDFFGCQVKIGETDVFDIIFRLGHLERDWAIN
jgi:hypothetical protein